MQRAGKYSMYDQGKSVVYAQSCVTQQRINLGASLCGEDPGCPLDSSDHRNGSYWLGAKILISH